jgi:hypothetical protein
MSSQSLTTATSSFTPHVEAWLKLIHSLAEEIGPRGSTTEGERRGHEYCRETLTNLGFEARWEIFQSAKSVFHPFLIVSLLMLLAFVIYPLAGRVSIIVAALITLSTLISARTNAGIS